MSHSNAKKTPAEALGRKPSSRPAPTQDVHACWCRGTCLCRRSAHPLVVSPVPISACPRLRPQITLPLPPATRRCTARMPAARPRAATSRPPRCTAPTTPPPARAPTASPTPLRARRSTTATQPAAMPIRRAPPRAASDVSRARDSPKDPSLCCGMHVIYLKRAPLVLAATTSQSMPSDG